MSVKIRPYRKEDYNKIIDICLKTGNSGEDASDLFLHGELLGLFFAAPYVVHEPEVCFVIANDEDEALGYIIGTKDSEKFAEWCEANWFPELRRKYPIDVHYKSSFEKRIVELIHTGYIPRPEAKLYPAHLHIDLLPEAQGMGMGKKLIQTFIEKLKKLKVTGLHLEVGRKNERAIGFYKAIGFKIISEYEYSILFGMKL